MQRPQHMCVGVFYFYKCSNMSLEECKRNIERLYAWVYKNTLLTVEKDLI